jgi:O-antigen/teichoic acid export membrane protein
MNYLRLDDKPLSAKIARNIAFGGVRALVIAPVPFLLTPLILRKIGAVGYGTWAVFVMLASLTSLADLGLVGTLSKHVAEYYAHRDYQQLNRLLNTGLVVFGILASFVVTVLWIASGKVVGFLFRDSFLARVELLSLFHCLLILIGVNILMFLSSSVTTGLQRIDLTNILSAFNVVCAAVAGSLLLLAGWGLRGLVYGSVGSAVVTFLIYLWLVRRLLPEIRLNPLLADIHEAKKIFAFSWRMYLVQASAAIHSHIEKVFLALFVGVAAVGLYDIASDVALKLRSVPGLLLSPILPAAAELDARGRGEKLTELYYRAHKYLAFIGVPLVFYVVAISNRFVDLWIGPNLKTLAVPISALLLANFFSQATGPGYLIFLGRGILNPGVYSAFIGIGLNIPLSFILIRSYGFGGAVVGTCVSLIAATASFVYLFHRRTGNSFVRLMREAYLKPVISSVTLLYILILVRPTSNLTWLGLFLLGVIFAIAYTLGLLFVQFFDRYDWDKIESVVPIARLARRIIPVA